MLKASLTWQVSPHPQSLCLKMHKGLKTFVQTLTMRNYQAINLDTQ